MNYDAASSTYPTMVELLRATSPHFASHIDSQGYVFNKALGKTEQNGTAIAAEQIDQVSEVSVY